MNNSIRDDVIFEGDICQLKKEEQNKNKRFPFSEAELLKGMTAHTAHADEVVRIAHYDDEELPNSVNNDAC